MKIFLIDPVNTLPDNYPLYSLIKGVLEKLESVTGATYSDIVTASGQAIRVVNEMSLGDIIDFVSIVLFTLTIIFFFFANKVWSPTK
jgi:hypothetical protein